MMAAARSLVVICDVSHVWVPVVFDWYGHRSATAVAVRQQADARARYGDSRRHVGGGR